jgi:hypothetical protein
VLQNTFYIPFWYQSVQGVDAVTSGVRMIPFALSQVVALIGTGALVAKTGHYVRMSMVESMKTVNPNNLKVPFIIIGELICIAGTALLTRLETNTPTLAWASYLVVAGLGMGIAMQLPYTAIQVVLR